VRADAASDVDFRVELEPGRSLFDLGGLLMDLQEYLHCKVDLMMPAVLKSHVRERVEDLIKRDERALGSQLKRIMAHMLKQHYQPQRASRSWIDSIENGHEEITDILDQSPSLRRTLPDLMTKNYPRPVAQASRDTRLPVDHFPTQPPFTLEEVLSGD
jgi:hypothetical protein